MKRTNPRNARVFYNVSLTVIHNASVETVAFAGRLRVICESVSSPNMRNPKIATARYTVVESTKLRNNLSEDLQVRKD